jgi:hypothetical protein
MPDEGLKLELQKKIETGSLRFLMNDNAGHVFVKALPCNSQFFAGLMRPWRLR